MKQTNSIQVNGNVYGGIHVHGQRTPQLPAATPSPSGRGSGALWMLAKGLGLLAVGAFALVGAIGLAAALLVVVLGVLALAIGWYLVCRAANLVLLVERALDGGPTRLVAVPHLFNAARSLGPGERVNEIESTEMTRYVD